MSKTIYLSPSNHGVKQNKCKIAGCYEDKHTRPIADETAKHLKYNGFNVIVADANRSVIGRCNDANKLGVDLYVPIHTNASSSSSARYLLFMAYNTTGKYDTLFDCVKSYMKDIYDGNIVLQKRRNLIEINTPKAMSFYCEMGFHTNLNDCNNFIHEPEKIGKALAQGICKYFGVAFKDYTAKKTTAKKVVTEDGVWGVNTTKYTQKLLKTTVDGVVSGQRTSCKKYLPAANTKSWEFKIFGKGSAMIKSLQKFLKLEKCYAGKIDGLAGKNTVTALQKFLKAEKLYTGKIDGIMGYATVVALQKFLNLKF